MHGVRKSHSAATRCLDKDENSQSFVFLIVIAPCYFLPLLVIMKVARHFAHRLLSACSVNARSFHKVARPQSAVID